MNRASTILMIALLASCGKSSSEEKKAAPPPAVPQAPSSPSSATGALPAPEPEVSITVNNLKEGAIPRGWPLIIKVLLRPPSSGPLTLKAAGKPWQDLVSLEVEGNPCPVKRALATAESIVLTGTHWGLAVWILTPEESAGLSPGTTRLKAIVRSPGKPGEPEWHGEASSPTIAFEVVESRTDLAPDEREAFTEASMQAAIWKGDREGALVIADRALSEDPKQWRVLHLRGSVLRRLGKEAEALGSYTQARDAWTQAHPGATPPALLFEDRDLPLKKKVNPR